MPGDDEIIIADDRLDFGPKILQVGVEAAMHPAKPWNVIHPRLKIEQPLRSILGPGANNEPDAGRFFEADQIAFGFEDAVPEYGLRQIIVVDARAKGGGGLLRFDGR